ncbi:MAG: DUF2065 domain-containing protein [Xanthobacteraceae bacterium]|nr:DUF2065 domain-containing protein [Xanthobacteraceae bacterium]
MRSVAVSDFLIGIGVLLFIEGLLFTAMPGWMRRAMQSAIVTPDMVLRIAGISSAVAGLIVIWVVRR